MHTGVKKACGLVKEWNCRYFYFFVLGTGAMSGTKEGY